MAAVPNILITGFGLFHNIAYNTSELLVASISQKWAAGGDYNLITQVFPVSYSEVLSIADLYQTYNPVVAIHLGLACKIDGIRLECCARNSGYTTPDINGLLPDHNICDSSAPELCHTGFEVNQVINTYRSRNSSVPIALSIDAGKFLCEFIYFKGLNLSQSKRVVFVHVPLISEVYTIEKLTQAIMDILSVLVNP